MNRRDVLRTALAAAGSAALVNAQAAQAVPDERKASPKRYKMKKSINLWAFPYPDRMSLKECLQLAKDAGFDGIELNYDLESDLSPKSGPKEFASIRKEAERIGIAISGVCSFLFWPYPLTSNDPQERARGMELAAKMTEAAHHLGAENLLVVPGAVHMPWREDHDPTPNDVCDSRALAAIGKLLPAAEKLNFTVALENMLPGEQGPRLCSRPEHFERIIAEFAHPNLGFCLDTGHALVAGGGHEGARAFAETLRNATNILSAQGVNQ